VLKDQWALENLRKATRHGEVLLWSDGLHADLRKHVPVTLVASLEEGLERAFDKHGPDARVIVMPNGPYVLPFVAAGKPTDSIV
jgi:nickel-dependent lactate racemase